MDRRARLTRVAAWLVSASLLLPAQAFTGNPPSAGNPLRESEGERHGEDGERRGEDEGERRGAREWDPRIVAADFVIGVDNRYFPLPVGRITSFRGTTPSGTQTLEVEVTGATKLILGVMTMVVIERHTENGELVEVSENWFAQHRNGDVFYFGEFTQNYSGGVPAGTEGSWEAGVDGARPGIIMKGDPEAGDRYFQEFAPGIAQDQARVIGFRESETVLYDTFQNVLRTKEWTALDPGVFEHKTYARGIGLILEEGDEERLELVDVHP